MLNNNQTLNGQYTPLTVEDEKVLAHDRAYLTMIRDAYFSSRNLSGTRAYLDLLQEIFDNAPWTDSEPIAEVIATGTVFGDVIAAELGCAWVKYSDEQGEDLALRYGETSVTRDMLIKRMEQGEYEIDLSYLFAQVCLEVKKMLAAE